MATAVTNAADNRKCDNDTVGTATVAVGATGHPEPDDSSESDGETEPAKSFHRRLSTNRDIKCSASLKEGYLLKQTWSFQRWRRRYFKLRGRKLYYAKDTKAVIFDEIELTDLCLAECSTKNVNHSFQVITPFRSLVLCADSRREMEDWLGALSAASQRRFHEPDQPDCLSGNHHWYATSHARPTYCNVCRDALNGVTSHGLSCEVCKCKVHKRCAAKAINNCKWTTLSSVGKDIIEDTDGNITMPHQWIEGNLPVSAKCTICDKNCGSVLRLQDWRCLWCRSTVHTQCRPHVSGGCPLGVARVSVVPPTALHSVQDEAWEAVRPQASSPLLVFVNSKSGDNQGVKFLRRFKQLLNPAQVFDLISTGPRLGLRLFRHFDPFRILVCSGDGSVGWVLSEIDKLDMHKQCQVAVLPLGTGNDLARVLGWGSSCDDDTHLPQLLEKYEKASTKILDRWSVMAFERTIAMPKLSLVPDQSDGILHAQITQYEDNLVGYLQNILQSDETSVVVTSAKRLCETVKDFATQVSESSLTRGDEQLNKKCDILQQKLDVLLQTLTCGDQIPSMVEVTAPVNSTQQTQPQVVVEYDEEDMPKSVPASKDDTESEMSYERKSEKSEKDLSNINFRKHRRTSRFMEREKDALILRANSLKRAIRSLVEHTESVVDAQSRKKGKESVGNNVGGKGGDTVEDGDASKMDNLKVMQTIESGSSTDVSSCPTPTSQASGSSVLTARLVSLSPMPDIRRDSTSEDPDLYNLPVPPDFADSRRSSQIQQSAEHIDLTEKILIETCTTLTKTYNKGNGTLNEPETDVQQVINQRRDSTMNYRREQLKKLETEQQEHNAQQQKYDEDEKECSSIMSTMSNEEASLCSEIADPQKSFCPRKNSDGEDLNGHIGHIDSPETDPNSDAFQGESLLDDLSSMLGNDMYGNDLDSMENTIADDSHPGLYTTTSNSSIMMTTDLNNPANPNQQRRKSFCTTGFKQLQQQTAGQPHQPKTSIKRRVSVPTRIPSKMMAGTMPASGGAEDEFGFENQAFMRQHVYLEQKRAEDEQPVKYCSLAQFVEGNDIARRSFKHRPQKQKSVGVAGVIVRQGSVPEEKEPSIKGSKTSLNMLVKELSNLSEKDEDVSDHLQFPRFSMVVEPPSPDHIKTAANKTQSKSASPAPPTIEIDCSDHDNSPTSENHSPFTGATVTNSNISSSSNLLGIDNEHFLSASPAATRRISCCSMLNANETAILAAAAATSKFYDNGGSGGGSDKRRSGSIMGGGTMGERKEDKEKDVRKQMPIINPLVQLPTWPNVSTGTGFIGKCLLANADTLCAAVSPLIDPDDALLEGFFERCVMNNYFGIGIDAKISLDFHHKREEHPEKCRSRAKNYMWYGVLGSKQFLQKTYKNLAQRVQLECDGQRIPLPSLQGIVILNIPSFMGGINFWGNSKEGDFLLPSFDDKILEVVAVFGSVQMAASRLINLQHHRIAQCQSIQINILGDEGVPIQVDGEAWIQPPGIIRILHKNRMQMLCRNRALENSLKSWEEKQKHSISAQGAASSSATAVGAGSKPRGSIVSHDKGRSSLTRQSMPAHEKSFLGVHFEKMRQHSFSGPVPAHHPDKHHTVTFLDKPLPPAGTTTTNNPPPPDNVEFAEEEHYLLLHFIECATNLAKWIKILAISYSEQLEALFHHVDLYSLAERTEHCLERIHPHGKLLPAKGGLLRAEFTRLVTALKVLYEESCGLLHEQRAERQLHVREDLESKLSVSLANAELELRRCVLYETEAGSMVYLQPVVHEEQGEHHKRKGLFWLKFRGRMNSVSGASSGTANDHHTAGGSSGLHGVGGGRRRCGAAATRDTASWGVQEVATWLETLQLVEYTDSFVRNDIRGRELLTLARRDLKDLGVTKVGHVKRILQAVKDLTQGN